MIFHDPTESRTNSPIAQQLSDLKSVTLPGLEAMTGADILITPLEKPRLPDALTGALPHQIIMRQHCEAGAWFIARKSGRDAVSSIPDYRRLWDRMRQWDAVPWLLITGRFVPNVLGNVIANGMETGFPWVAFQSTIEDWQLDGGYCTPPLADEQVGAWLKHADVRLAEWAKSGRRTKVIAPRDPARDIIGLTSKDAQIVTLISMPGIGPVLGRRLWDRFGKNLSNIFTFMSDTELYDEDPGLYPEGIGRGTVEKWQKWLGGRLIRE